MRAANSPSRQSREGLEATFQQLIREGVALEQRVSARARRVLQKVGVVALCLTAMTAGGDAAGALSELLEPVGSGLGVLTFPPVQDRIERRLFPRPLLAMAQLVAAEATSLEHRVRELA